MVLGYDPEQTQIPILEDQNVKHSNGVVNQNGDESLVCVNSTNNLNSIDGNQTSAKEACNSNDNSSNAAAFVVEASNLNPTEGISTSANGVCNNNDKASKMVRHHTIRKERRRRVIPKLKDLARAKALKMKRKSKQKRKGDKILTEGAEVSNSSNQVNISFDSSISGSVSEWRKWVLLHEGPEAVARGVWDFGRDRSINFEGEEGEVLKNLSDIEIRDREKYKEHVVNSEETKGISPGGQ
ncbi:hypothetical protein A2U01_0030435 [Trifolium medium]|uniref:Uncharacterized protein n=1 Tax=Trifolium medium TaxID=97028 RepID=A0A392PCY6_9FABA|nr:hypothetical protein [Trifolium medium]